MQPTKLQTKKFEHKLHVLFRITHDDDLIHYFRVNWKYSVNYDDIITHVNKEIIRILDNDFQKKN